MKFVIPASEGIRFDQVCAIARGGDTIELESGGEYPTAGAWAFPAPHFTLQSGVTLIASGARIVLRDPAITTGGVVRPDKDLFLLRAGDDVTIVGGLWDANYRGNLGWHCSGLRFYGKFRVKDLTIVGLRGSRQSQTPSGAVEVFAISSEGNTGGSVVEAVSVKDCEVSSSESYVSGIFLGGTRTDRRSVISDCVVNLGELGQFAYSANQPTTIQRCIGMAERGFYNDTGDTVGCNITDCTFVASYAGISLVSGTTPSTREVLVRDCNISAPRMVEWWEREMGAPMNGGVIVNSSKFKGAMLAATKSPRGNISFADITWTDQGGEPFSVQGQGARPVWFK